MTQEALLAARPGPYGRRGTRPRDGREGESRPGRPTRRSDLNGPRLERSGTLQGVAVPIGVPGLSSLRSVRPIVQGRQVKICAIGPHQPTDLWIELDLIEERCI